MIVTLRPEQESWLAARVASGEFSSVEEAVRRLIDESIADRDAGEDDMEWAKPLVDIARAQAQRGEILTLEEHRARNAARLAALQK